MKTLLHKIILGLCTFALSGLALAQRPAFMPGQVVVKSDAVNIDDYEIIKTLPKSGLLVLQVEKGKEIGQAMKLRKKGVFANPNYIAHATATPLDPLYPSQWHMDAIQLEIAWDITKGAKLGGAQVRVAVLDTGIADGGKDGVNLCASGHYDVVNGDNDPSDGSQLSHGTHVAGTISQVTTFSGSGAKGVAGVAPEACVVVVKVLNDRGNGTFADIAEGIYHAADPSAGAAQVINMSLGVDAAVKMYSDLTVDTALTYAEGENVLIVAAAGNDGFSENVSYPAINSSVVAVGATGFDNKVTGYSNRGDGLDIVAPGGDTAVDLNGDGYSDGVLQETKYRKKFGYYFLQGTSMASPHVAGVAALMFAHTFSTVESVKNALYSSTKDLYTDGHDETSGYGLVQANAALLMGGGGSSTELTAPTGLQPANGDEDVSVDTIFSWGAVAGANGYRIKVGLDLNSPEIQEEISASSTSYNPSTPLQNYGTAYDWSVQAYKVAGEGEETAIAGASFTTEAAPEDPPDCIPTAKNEKGPRRGNDGIDNDCDGVIDG